MAQKSLKKVIDSIPDALGESLSENLEGRTLKLERATSKQD